MDDHGKTLCAISDQLFTKKVPWDSFCQDLANNYYPMRADFTRTLRLGDDFATGTMDSTPINNRETLGNAIDSMLRQGQWYEVTTGDVDRDKKQDNALALAYATRKHRALISDRRSQFDRCVKESDQDWVTFGECPISVEFNIVERHLVFRPWHPRDIATMTDGYGVVDTVHRKAVMSARAICAKFNTGEWKGTLAPEIKQACEKEPFKEFHIRHVMMPADDLYNGTYPKGHKNAKYVSIYIDMDHKNTLNEAPAKVFNYVVPRWRKLNNHPQGFSPLAINSLPDARMLQNMALVILEQGQKAVDPSMVGSLEAFRGSEINLYAGGFTYADLPDGKTLKDIMTTVDTSQGLQAGVELKQDIRTMLAEGWLLNKLFLPDLKEMTAYEASVRTEEFRRAALPFFTPIQSEYHSAVLGVAWDMAVNMNMIDLSMFPPDLHGKDLVFQYTSPLEEAEGQQVVAAFQQSIAIVAAGAQVDQTVASLFDVHTATIDAVRGSGAEPEWILPPDQLAAAKAKAANDKAVADQAQKLAMGSQIAGAMSGATMAARQAGLLKGPPGAMPQGAPAAGAPAPAP